MITQTYSLDLVPNGKPVVVPVSQYDNDRMLVFKLFESGVAYDASGVASAVFTGRKPDDHFFMASMTVGSDNVSVALTAQMTAVAGNTKCEIILYDTEGNQLGTTNFVMQVEKAPVDDSTKISESDISAILTALSDSQKYANSAESAAESASSTAAALESLVPATSGNVGDVLVRGDDGSDWSVLTAEMVSYDTSTSELTSAKVQGAIDEVVGKINALQTKVGDMSAADVSYSTSTSGLDVANTQEAIDKLASSRNLRVNVTYDASTDKYSANHTYAEILANLQSNAIPYVMYKNRVFKYQYVTSSLVSFVYLNEEPVNYTGLFNQFDSVTISITSAGDVIYTNWGNKYILNNDPEFVEITVPANSKSAVFTDSAVPTPDKSIIEVLPLSTYSTSQATLFTNAKFVPTGHTTGSVTVYATGTAPTEALNVKLKITRI